MKTFRDQVIDLRDWVEREAKSADDRAHDMKNPNPNARTLAWESAAVLYIVNRKLNKILGDV